MIANLTAYKELGIEPATTLDEAYQQCATAKAAGKSLYMIAGAGPPNLGLFASQVAASLVYGADPDWNTKRANKEVTFADSQEWQATLQQVIDYKDKGCFPDGVEGAGFPELTNAITSGSSLGIFAPSGAVVDSKAAAPTQEFGAYVLPAATVADTRSILSTVQRSGRQCCEPEPGRCAEVAGVLHPAEQPGPVRQVQRQRLARCDRQHRSSGRPRRPRGLSDRRVQACSAAEPVLAQRRRLRRPWHRCAGSADRAGNARGCPRSHGCRLGSDVLTGR